MSAWHRCAAVILVWVCAGAVAAGNVAPAVKPVLQVDYPFPTADKPQSKSWFSHGRWWAILPRLAGPSLWERTPAGWSEHPEVRAALAGLPGRADVWWDGECATAVSAADRIIRVFRLRPTSSSAVTWRAEVLAFLPSPADDAIETVTLARDGEGAWWIATAVQEKIHAWSSGDAAAWSPPVVIGRGVDADDICAVVPSPGGVGVIWSNQKLQTMNMRLHRSGRRPEDWEPSEVIEAGNRNADDHIRAAPAPDGTLWVATKNSLDALGEPQLVLRIRSPDGNWRNLPYGRLSPGVSLTRPTIALAPDGSVWMGHSSYGDGARSEIVFGRVDPSLPGLFSFRRAVIAPDPRVGSRVNDPCGPKAMFPEDGEWLVLASDAAGRVYEADLRSFREPRALP